MVRVLFVSAIVVLMVGLALRVFLMRLAGREESTSPVTIPACVVTDGVRAALPPAPETPEERFSRRMETADRLIVTPPSAWTDAERRTESNLYAWVGQSADVKLPWSFDEAAHTGQYGRVRANWNAVLARRAGEIAQVVAERDDAYLDACVEQDWAVRSHAFLTNECARLEPLRRERVFPLVNVKTNALIRLIGYRKVYRTAPSLVAWRTDVVTGVHIFTNSQHVAGYLDLLKQTADTKAEQVRCCEDAVLACSNRLIEARRLHDEAKANLVLIGELPEEAPTQEVRDLFTAWRRWVLKSILLLTPE